MDFLTDSERQYIDGDNERKRAVAVGRLSELALAVQNTEQVLDALRETDVETARKIGKAAREVVALLERLSIAEVVSDAQASATPSLELPQTEEVKPTVQAEEQERVEMEVSAAELKSEVIAEVPSETEADKVEENAEGSSLESAERWLEKVLGDDWRAKIGAEDDDSIETLAEKTLSKVKIRKNKGEPADLHKTRLIGLLKGLSPREIAETGNWGSPDAIRMFGNGLRKRLNNSRPGDSPADKSEPKPTPQLHIIPHQRVEVVVPIRKEEEREPGQLPKYAQFAELLQQQLDLNSTEKVSLESFFDPKSRGEMTKAKEAALEKVIEHLQSRIDNPEFKLTPEELKWVRSCFGLFSRNGVAEKQPPKPLSDLRRRLGDAAQAPRLEEAFFSGLQKLIVNGPQLDMRELYASDFMRAATTPESIDDDRFSELRRELALLLEKQFDESVAYEVGHALEHDITPSRNADSSAELRAAFARVRQLIGVGEVKTTGDAEIDKALRRFVAVKRVGNMAAEMNEEELRLYQRRVVAGLYTYLQASGNER